MKLDLLQLSDLEKLFTGFSYREFIKNFIQIKKEKFGRFGYSDIARRAGFSSRSFPREVASGAKRITSLSLAKFTKGMGLTGDLAEYFRSLVYLEHADVRPVPVSEDRLQKEILNLQVRIRREIDKGLAEREPFVFSKEHYPVIHAALGNCETGASVSEISAKTGLDPKIVVDSLRVLVEKRVVGERSGRYIPLSHHINIDGLGDVSGFKEHFLAELRKAEAQAHQAFGHKEKLFFTGNFSVSDENLPRLKKELRQLLSRFVEDSEDSKGQHIASLVCAFT